MFPLCNQHMSVYEHVRLAETDMEGGVDVATAFLIHLFLRSLALDWKVESRSAMHHLGFFFFLVYRFMWVIGTDFG